ncbi:MAG: erythromycin esterase family protein [Acidobacteria bacterium]|nr:erythromycin esterase family protein [Acidobacteriota bacterium]
MVRFVGVIMLSLGMLSAAPKTFLNLDFETATRGMAWGWVPANSSGFLFAADGEVAFSGARSLRIANTGAAPGTTAATYQHFPIEIIRGRHVHLSGYIQTSGITGYAGYWMRVVGPSGERLGFNDMSGIGPGGSTGWQQYSFEVDVSPDAVDVLFGTVQKGDGTAWFDQVAITLDGLPYEDAAAPNTGEPAASQLQWLARTAVPFISPNPSSDLADLSGVSGIVGDAHLVGLGEGTHGTSEFFQMKHRILEYLAGKQGFTVFAMEANMPECEQMNQYVLTGQGDPKNLLQALHYWTWNTQEVLDMIGWIRQYNAAGKGPILFTGFDMQYAAVAAGNVRDFVARAEPSYLPTVQSVYGQAVPISESYMGGTAQSTAAVQPVVGAVHAVWSHLWEKRAQYLASFPAREVDWAIQSSVVVEQATYNTIAPATYRDQAMAANMEWILQRNPGARAVLWAHDQHVWKEPQAMGSFLAANHGADYVAFGQIFHAGSYNAIGQPGGLQAWPAEASFPGTVEYAFHSLGKPWCMLDLRRASGASPSRRVIRHALGGPGGAWLLGPVQYRMVGSMAIDGFLYSDRLAQDFDALIFFDQSTPSRLLPFN